jgi:2-dehydro-3-deoxy-D-arabinonate dehydratase
VVFDGTTSTAKMVRSCEELIAYLKRCNVVPQMSVLLTGTSLVPPDEMSLESGDVVEITIESIGTLVNPVVSV